MGQRIIGSGPKSLLLYEETILMSVSVKHLSFVTLDSGGDASSIKSINSLKYSKAFVLSVHFEFDGAAHF